MNKHFTDKQIGERVRQIRAVRNVTQTELGKILNHSKQTISLLENGKRKLYASELKIILDYFKIEVEIFFRLGYFI